MASMNMDIPHNLSQDEATSRIKNLLSKLKSEQKDKISNVQEEWSDNKGHFQFTIQGFDLGGVILVQPFNVRIEADIPFALTFFKGTITRVITDKAKEVLQ